MLMALLWLTVGTPITLTALAEKQKQEKTSSGQVSDCTNCPTEEKNEDSTPVLQEFLPEHGYDLYPSYTLKEINIIPFSDTYISFHPPLFSPPPES